MMLYCEFYPNCTGILIGICTGKGLSDSESGWGDKCPHFKLSKRVRRKVVTEFELMMKRAIDET